MARIQLRDSTIYLMDGLSGSAAVNDAAGFVAAATSGTIDTVVLNTTTTDKVPVGARFTIAGETGTPIHTVTGRTPSSGNPTTAITFTPAIATGGVIDNAVITFLPQKLTIKIGDGDLSWNETRDIIYDLDRDLLDGVRLGAQQPLTIDLAFVFEYITTESGKVITPIDAIKRQGEASEWVSTDSDLCNPYAVDILVEHDIPCGTDLDQDFLFQDFRYDDLNYSIQDASVTVAGSCNVTEVVSTRLTIT